MSGAPFMWKTDFVVKGDAERKTARRIETDFKKKLLKKLHKTSSTQTIKSDSILYSSFITSRLYFCNSLYGGLDQTSIKHLQLVQNAARLLTRQKKRDHGRVYYRALVHFVHLL